MLFMILAAAVFVVPEAEIFACTPVQVWDADGPIWCAEGPRIRLHGIAAREMDGTCRHGHPTTHQDAGLVSRQAESRAPLPARSPAPAVEPVVMYPPTTGLAI